MGDSDINLNDFDSNPQSIENNNSLAKESDKLSIEGLSSVEGCELESKKNFERGDCQNGNTNNLSNRSIDNDIKISLEDLNNINPKENLNKVIDFENEGIIIYSFAKVKLRTKLTSPYVIVLSSLNRLLK